MHRRCSVLSLVVEVLLVSSAVAVASQPASQAGPGAPAAPAAVAGKVTDSQGKAVAGAKVAVCRVTYSSPRDMPKVEVRAETTTGAEGEFTFSAEQSGTLYKGGCIVARKEGLAVGWAVGQRPGGQRFDITLETPTDLSGVVVDEQGQPVAEADVGIETAVNRKAEDTKTLVIWWTPPGFFNTKTDSGGHFVFAGMPAGATFEFLVKKPGYATVSTRSPVTMVESGPPTLQFAPGQAGIKLTLFREASIEGTVIEKAGGKPVAGMAIMVQPGAPRSPLPLRPVVSGPDGTFRMGGLAPGSYTMQLPMATERTAEWVAEPVRVSVEAGQAINDVKIQLIQGGIVEVLVKDTAGQPVEKAQVGILRVPDRQYFTGRTDENGLVRMRVTPGQYVLSAVYREGQPGRAIQQPERVAVEEGQTKRIEHVMSSMPKVAGTVQDEAGNLLAGVKIEVKPTGREETVTDASGKFEAAWDPASWGPQSTTFVLVARDLTRNLAEAVDMEEQPGNLDVKLRPGLIITGIVLDQEGKPLSRARIQVMLRVSNWGSTLGRGEVLVGPEGRFEVKALPPGRKYVVMALADGYGKQDVSIGESDFKDNCYDAGQLKLPLADLSITGVVVDPNDKPVAGASVYGYGQGQPDLRNIVTDAQGKFAIKGVCAGPIRLSVNSRGAAPLYGSAQTEGGATDLRIVISARPTGQSYMPRRPTSLKGRPLPPLKDLGIDLPAEAEGKMLLVCFWDMGQRPSRYCLMQLAAQAAPLGAKGVAIVAVHAATVEGGALSQWIEQNKIPFQAGIIAGDVEKTKLAWGVASLPHLILTDKKHVVVAEGFGLSDLDKQIETAAGR